MNPLWLGLIVLALSSPLLIALVAFRRRTPPDDSLALRLAAALDTAPPAIVDLPHRGLVHRVEFTRDGARHELLVGERGGSLRRFGVQGNHAARIFSAARQGRAQEDYSGGRVLVPERDGWVAIEVEHSTDTRPALRGWETRIPDGFAAAMRELTIEVLLVERTSLEAYGPEIDVDWVEATIDLFTRLRVSFPTE